ncbi:hypothetical protein ONZ45_g8979 [Pleurotus djamor]|nr:hypothetical protein ONZ45_g8979 [Pleurotus djamor]
MARTESATPSDPKPAAPASRRKSTSGGKKKLTPFNKYMQAEMARLKEDEPEISHKERFKKATENWKDAKANPKNLGTTS